MEIKKCVECGGSLVRLRMQRAWKCPYCDARYEDKAHEDQVHADQAEPVEYYGLNDEVFEVKKDLSKTMKKGGGAGCILSIVHCMNTFENAEQVEEYMIKKIPFSTDISVKGVREDQIAAAMPVLQAAMDSDERIIVLGNKGIFSKGKEYFVVTDKRSIFVNKKQVKTVPHTDIDSLKIETSGNCYVNGDYDKGFINLDGKGQFQGAMLALICMLAFEADPERGRVQIC